MLKLTDRKRAPGRAGVRATKAAGWLSVVFGTVHTALAPWDVREVWSKVADEGWLNTFTLARPTTLSDFERAEAFWVSMGSFGVPVLILGGYILWSARQGHRVPGWIGAVLVVWAGALVVVLPASPGWVLLGAGVLILVGDKRHGRQVTVATQS